METFLTPDPLHPLVIDAPAIKPQPSVDKPPAPAHGYDCEASAPRCLPVAQGAAGYCGVDLSTGRHAAGKPGIDPAEPPRPCDDAPGLEVSLGKLLKHRLIEFCVSKEALKAGVLQLKLF